MLLRSPSRPASVAGPGPSTWSACWVVSSSPPPCRGDQPSRPPYCSASPCSRESSGKAFDRVVAAERLAAGLGVVDDRLGVAVGAAVFPRFVGGLAGEAGEFGDPAADVFAGRVELQALADRVEDPEVRRRVRT